MSMRHLTTNWYTKLAGTKTFSRVIPIDHSHHSAQADQSLFYPLSILLAVSPSSLSHIGPVSRFPATVH
ncbi:hypothetical protein F9C07_4800 [Aspergillus flavus]|uniref:Uncharacterized protein n=1 Tax=Aspergillus flavus (strain ATCC 200026 / FGSC A1120 / IAM 13836 / NRRL 3357 / JCM 12722 / SRRC 167) TaxID=332952 RepID=A0A7U2ML56_ASPFN|nr:hypothetical protein F9C07_4800 [Aspergillus flavus]